MTRAIETWKTRKKKQVDPLQSSSMAHFSVATIYRNGAMRQSDPSARDKKKKKKKKKKKNLYI